MRVLALHEVDSNGDGAWDQRIQTDYLSDPHNHTGYSQVLRETHYDAGTGALRKTIDYTIGLDEIAQTITTYDAQGNVVSRETLIFGHDGHGSVRILFDLAGALVQLYVYEAYGQLAAIYNAAGQFLSANPADARTTILDDGEPFDNRIGWGYRRARWVDPHTGRFNGFDPFFGNLWEPQSFHKYVFVAGDPINSVDPSGLVRISPSIGRMIASLGVDLAIRILIGIRATYVLGEAYRKETNPRGNVAINLAIGRIGDPDLPNGRMVKEFKNRPDIVDHDKRTVYEVKSELLIPLGYKEVEHYIDILGRRYPGRIYTPGMWQPRFNPYEIPALPGIIGLPPITTYAWNAGGGVIAYWSPDAEAAAALVYIGLSVAQAVVARQAEFQGRLGPASLILALGIL